MPPRPSASTGPRGNSAHLRNKGRQKTIFQQLSFSHDYFQSNFAEEFVHKDLQKDHRPPLLESAKNPSGDRRSDPRSSRYQERQSRDSLENLNLNSKNLSSRCLIVGHLRASSFSEAAGIATSPRSSPRLSSRAHRGLDRWGSSTLQIPRTPPPRCSRLCICIILVFIWTRIPFPARSR
jgi:hypothetical protein